VAAVPRSRLIAIATALVLVTSVFARVAVAGIAWGDIECCCGEHAGDESCGCPDCPGADHAESDHVPPADGAPRMKSCGPDAQLVVPASIDHVVVPRAPALVAPTAIRAPALRASDPDPAPDVRPETPPPRHVAPST
jgi:hypothetical protein